MTEHSLLTGASLHEPKGVDGASANTVYIANGSGSGAWSAFPAADLTGTVTQGWWDYNDATTAGAPIALTTPGTSYALTNDGAGVFTNTSYGLAGLSNIWNTSTNRFQFNQGGVLSVGDTGSSRIDVSVTTSAANTEIELEMNFAEGTASAYSIPVITKTNFKTAGTYRIVGEIDFYIGNNDTLTAPASVTAKADTAGATVVVNGWYTRVLKTN